MSEWNDEVEFTSDDLGEEHRVEIPEDATLPEVIQFLNGMNIRHFGTDVDREVLPPGFRRFLVPDVREEQ